jgi:DNA-binding NarL/FixJ family response regulator
VLLVATHPLLRASLGRLLAEAPGLELAAEASDRAGLTVDPSTPVDVALLALDDESDLSAVGQIASNLDLPLVVIGAEDEVDFAVLAASGVQAYLPPDTTPQQLTIALQAVLAGLLVAPAPALGPAADSGSPVAAAGDDPLTDREMQVLQLVARGLPNKQIARRLNISEHTVKFHVGSILGKLGAASRTEAVTQAARRGLLTL